MRPPPSTKNPTTPGEKHRATKNELPPPLTFLRCCCCCSVCIVCIAIAAAAPSPLLHRQRRIHPHLPRLAAPPHATPRPRGARASERASERERSIPRTHTPTRAGGSNQRNPRPGRPPRPAPLPPPPLRLSNSRRGGRPRVRACVRACKAASPSGVRVGVASEPLQKSVGVADAVGVKKNQRALAVVVVVARAPRPCLSCRFRPPGPGGSR
ncbi:hypothetical protein DAI22_01g270850 [Oryza sativa Japonica Group]|nr:hypothetical protein DAI22_01g270850 [Oryza sativa Japonica Group]